MGYPWVSMGILQTGPYWWQWLMKCAWIQHEQEPGNCCNIWTAQEWLCYTVLTENPQFKSCGICLLITRSTRNDVSPGNAMFSGVRPLCKKDAFLAPLRSAYRPVQILWNMFFQKESSPTSKSMFLKEHSIYTYHFLYIHFTIHTIFFVAEKLPRVWLHS